ncbi:MAG: hypothetical protein ABI461_04055 [Polyangiaceae bacterium]
MTTPATHIARWDLDKTYLRTEFDTFRDLVRTAFERADQKRTNPGAATLLREMVRGGIAVHILSGSPEQMRRRLEDKLRLDGIVWESFTLKPNLENLLRLRFRAVKDQLGYKLPALLRSRSAAARNGNPAHETLFGDDAEADAFVYSLYADVVSGHVTPEQLLEICERGRVYPDVMLSLAEDARAIDRFEAVERILIHLEGQTPPDNFRVYGARVVPFYNYLQAAFVVHEDGRLGADAVLRVGVELVVQHRFDGDALARSYLDVARRGHLKGTGVEELVRAYATIKESLPASAEIGKMIDRAPEMERVARENYRGVDQPLPDYISLVVHHNARRQR